MISCFQLRRAPDRKAALPLACRYPGRVAERPGCVANPAGSFLHGRRHRQLFVNLCLLFCVNMVLAARGTREGPPRPRIPRLAINGLLAGVMAGCAVASKISAWPLVPMILLAAGVHLAHDHAGRPGAVSIRRRWPSCWPAWAPSPHFGSPSPTPLSAQVQRVPGTTTTLSGQAGGG